MSRIFLRVRGPVVGEALFVLLVRFLSFERLCAAVYMVGLPGRFDLLHAATKRNVSHKVKKLRFALVGRSWGHF